MTEFLLKRFVKDHEQVEKMSVRTAYGVLASTVGIFCNVFLFAIKLFVGITLHSVSVMADAFNNLSDAGSSIISFIGVKVAQIPADRNHPFGHGRAEYVAALFVSFLIIELGFTFLKDSLAKIRNPEELTFQITGVIILLLSITVKLWLGHFNRQLGTKINSKVMMAMFADSVGDVIATSATVFSIIFYAVTGINVDGFIGVGVSLVVMWAGFGIARDTLEPLLGASIDPDLYSGIKSFVEKYDGVVRTHDLMVHNYGPGRSMASIHAEVPNHLSLEEAHDIVDQIERDAQEQLGIILVAHIDPVETENEEVLKMRRDVEEAIRDIAPDCSMHDFHAVEGVDRINLIFDMIVPIDFEVDQRHDLYNQLTIELKKKDIRYQCIITMEHSFVTKRTEK